MLVNIIQILIIIKVVTLKKKTFFENIDFALLIIIYDTYIIVIMINLWGDIIYIQGFLHNKKKQVTKQSKIFISDIE